MVLKAAGGTRLGKVLSCMPAVGMQTWACHGLYSTHGENELRPKGTKTRHSLIVFFCATLTLCFWDSTLVPQVWARE